jgi:hypothetical protein
VTRCGKLSVSLNAFAPSCPTISGTRGNHAPNQTQPNWRVFPHFFNDGLFPLTFSKLILETVAAFLTRKCILTIKRIKHLKTVEALIYFYFILSHALLRSIAIKTLEDFVAYMRTYTVSCNQCPHLRTLTLRFS